MGQHGGLAVSAVAPQQEGPELDMQNMSVRNLLFSVSAFMSKCSLSPTNNMHIRWTADWVAHGINVQECLPVLTLQWMGNLFLPKCMLGYSPAPVTLRRKGMNEKNRLSEMHFLFAWILILCLLAGISVNENEWVQMGSYKCEQEKQSIALTTGSAACTGLLVTTHTSAFFTSFPLLSSPCKQLTAIFFKMNNLQVPFAALVRGSLHFYTQSFFDPPFTAATDVAVL